jgi:2',3'-cyclic-nucleotide 2'-phosphodiesterase (5'-nucleotidase family)
VRLTLLHTNDVHGRIDGLARVATLVERIREETAHRVLYVDSGDVEETTTRLSNLTKGVAMLRLLDAAGCEAAAVGNASWLRYGPQSVTAQAQAVGFPLLCANLKPIAGVRDAVVIDGVGFVGVTDPFLRFLETLDFGVRALPVAATIRREARSLRAAGAELVVVLSHLGLDGPFVEHGDRELAAELHDDVDLILGAHSHNLLPDGERVGRVLVAQAGEYAQHLGRVDVDGAALRASVIEVGDDVPPHPRVLAEAARAEQELDASLDQVLASLDEPLDAQWVARMLRRRFGADVGLVVEAIALERPLPPGPLRRRELWESCHTTANPGVAELTGAQLAELIGRGRDPTFETATPRPLRGRANGRLHVDGATALDPARTYRVAGTDAELDASGGLVDAGWGLDVRYEFPMILREAIEEELARG